jgi:hypothetical protein
MMKKKDIQAWLNQRLAQLEKDEEYLATLKKEVEENINGENYHEYTEKLAAAEKNIETELIIISVLEDILQ